MIFFSSAKINYKKMYGKKPQYNEPRFNVKLSSLSLTQSI